MCKQENRDYRSMMTIYILSGPHRGSPMVGQAPEQLPAVPKDVRPDTMHLSRFMTLQTRLHLELLCVVRLDS